MTVHLTDLPICHEIAFRERVADIDWPHVLSLLQQNKLHEAGDYLAHHFQSLADELEQEPSGESDADVEKRVDDRERARDMNRS